ncbi:hypothetical protein ITJ57_05775 [Plantibacter sp. VKM Ac-2880]|uniref:hypothetical protein n=1 Tax=Plantibacter sp. VKM Ac-2880 TaxID=2783827 RepID=UPI00188FA7CF|nr:hypothetical protein [Plantibacter sp. VKM Ac-2880]MBF4568274.1 hypothetical protein [Plantibacter sp. VKM Ac-2880]
MRWNEWTVALAVAGVLAIAAVLMLLILGPEAPVVWGLVSGVMLALVVATMAFVKRER